MRKLLIASVAVLALTVAGTATASTTIERTPFEGSFTNPCTNETFTVQGTIFHLLQTETGHDGTTVLVEIFRFDHVEGTTADGVRYTVPNVNVRRVIVRPDGSSSSSFVANQEFVRDGDDDVFPDGDDLTIHVLSSFDVDASGNVTNQRFETSLTCG